MRILLFSFLCLGVIFGCSTGNHEFLEDPANFLSASEKERIEQFHAILLKEEDIHFKVVFLRDVADDIDQKAVTLFDQYKLGAKTRAARGVLFLVDAKAEKVRMEIGYDLEAVFPDGFVGYVEEKQMAPFFAAGKIGAGVEATVELFVARAMKAAEIGPFAEDEIKKGGVGERFSGGAGAGIDVHIGSRFPEKVAVTNPDEFVAQPDPHLTLEKYLLALFRHVKDPNLGIYTPDTRRFFSQWVVTAAQQDHEFRELSQRISEGFLVISGGKAVIRFPLANRQSSPYFFRKDDEGWMLDFVGMSRWIQFNHKNQWHFKTLEHPYMFAFKDVLFDRHGFPHERRRES